MESIKYSGHLVTEGKTFSGQPWICLITNVLLLENLVRDHLHFASNMKRISVTLDRLKYFTFYNQITKRGYYPLCLLQSATSNHLNDFNNMPFRNSLTTWHCHMANIHKYKKNLKNIVPIRTKYNEIKKKHKFQQLYPLKTT